MISLIFFNLLIINNSSKSICPKIKTVENLNLTEYIREPWYILAQQETSYLPLDSNYCVYANYSKTNKIGA